MVKNAIITLVAVYVLILAGMYFGQRRLLYFPDPVRTAPATIGLTAASERIIEAPDGEKIVAWYVAAKPGQPTLLYFHGNGGALAGRAALIAKYAARGRGVFIMAYRGYSGSTGSPTEAANVADAKLAYDALMREGVKPQEIVIYGESLGTGVAVQVAREKPAAGVILDSPFTAVVDRAAEIYPWLPVRLLMKDRYESSRHIVGLQTPLLIVHGEVDDVVPVAMGRRLFAAANEPKEIVTLPGAGHNNHDLFGSFDAINNWIDRLRTGAIGR
jgi:uncharacterized protein